MGAGLSLQTRRAVLEHMAPAYRDALLAKKRVLLDEFTQTTGYLSFVSKFVAPDK